MAKMLDFLHRYQGTNRQQPSLAEARRLEDLIVSHSGALTVPDLEEELRGSGFTVGIKGFLLSNMYRGTKVRGSYGTDVLEESSSTLVSDTGSSRTAALCGEADSEGGSDALCLAIPPKLRDLVGKDFFLDLVTPRSLFLDNGPYIQTVALQCTQSWDLLDSDIERRRLAHFSMAVEAGYPDTHC